MKSHRFIYILLISFVAKVNVLLCSTSAHAGQSEKVKRELKERRAKLSLRSLRHQPVPRPDNLEILVRDEKALIAMGKALFWDMQLGVDGVQACASCHFAGGADNRPVNQVNPGFLFDSDIFEKRDRSFELGDAPNTHLRRSHFPTHKKSDPFDFSAIPISDSNDIISSQGVFFDEQGPDEKTDPLGFHVDSVNTRRVATRNSPTVINSVFYKRLFWDGRAGSTFNGVNTRGDWDSEARVFRVGENGVIHPYALRLNNSALASQALGPPISDFEMSNSSRTWMDISTDFVGKRRRDRTKPYRRIARLRPLSKQKVHPRDSVLGRLASRHGRRGLRVTSYAEFVQKAFKKEWWQTRRRIPLGVASHLVSSSTTSQSDSVSLMEANFPLFFGLAIQMYESTLISDDSRVDRYLDGDLDALTTSEEIGFFLAADELKCFNCHSGSLFSDASVEAFNETGPTLMVPLNGKQYLLDRGFHNLGVRDTREDLGVWGRFNGDSFSFARNAFLEAEAVEATTGPNLLGEVTLASSGAFKTPSLRNVELTAPYFHNGGQLTLEDVMLFYLRGGDFRIADAARHHPVIGVDQTGEHEVDLLGIDIFSGEHRDPELPEIDDTDVKNVVAFLKALTDDRVRYRCAPFDHPQLFVPYRHYERGGFTNWMSYNRMPDLFLEIKAVGANGGKELPRFEDLLIPG